MRDDGFAVASLIHLFSRVNRGLDVLEQADVGTPDNLNCRSSVD